MQARNFFNILKLYIVKRYNEENKRKNHTKSCKGSTGMAINFSISQIHFQNIMNLPLYGRGLHAFAVHWHLLFGVGTNTFFSVWSTIQDLTFGHKETHFTWPLLWQRHLSLQFLTNSSPGLYSLFPSEQCVWREAISENDRKRILIY